MPAQRLPMRQVREVLRLKHVCGRSGHQIAAAVGVSRYTVAEYLRRAAAIWPAQASALATLAAAYAPVRYGGGITEAQSDAAERSAALILAGSLPAAPVFSDHSTADRPRSERQGLT